MQYLTFTPWRGLLNNVRMCLETALSLAYLTKRTLVMPNGFRPNEFANAEFHEFLPPDPRLYYDFDLISHAVPVITEAEYQPDWADQYNISFEPDTSVICWPSVPADSRDLMEFAAGRSNVLQIPNDTRTLHLGPALEYFYTFFYCQNPNDSLALRQIIRDHVRYTPAIYNAAERIINAIGPFHATHIRRTDFLDLRPECDFSAQMILPQLLRRIPAGSKLYIATDEVQHPFFEPLRQHYSVLFLRHFESMLPRDLSPIAIGCVEQLICAAAGVFVGTHLSTFTSYINRLRGYNQAPDTEVYFTDGTPGSEMDAGGRYSWTNWRRQGRPIWGREYRDGWNFSA